MSTEFRSYILIERSGLKISQASGRWNKLEGEMDFRDRNITRSSYHPGRESVIMPGDKRSYSGVMDKTTST